MRVAVGQKNERYHSWPAEKNDAQSASRPSSSISRDSRSNGDDSNSMDVTAIFTTEEDEGCGFHRFLTILLSLDIDRDRAQIVDVLDEICSADHLYLYQPLCQTDVANSMLSKLLEEVIMWLEDLLIMSNAVSDTTVVCLVCTLLEKFSFSSSILGHQSMKRFFDPGFMAIVLRAGLQSGVHSECFNILTYCINNVHNYDDQPAGTYSPRTEYSSISWRESIGSLCSSGDERIVVLLRHHQQCALDSFEFH